MDLTQRTKPQYVKADPSTVKDVFLDISDARVERIVTALESPGSSLVLSGEPGCGKAYLAQAAAYALEKQSGDLRLTVMGDLDDFTGPRPDAPSSMPYEVSARILDAIEHRNPGSELLIVALNIDGYDAYDSAVLEQLVRSRRARFIGTAQQIVGAADRLARDPGVYQLAVEPLTLEESGRFLSSLLGVESIGPRILSRWHAATRGNQHALVTLALSAERRGIVRRVRKVAWVPVRDELAPSDFIAQLGELTTLEQTALDFAAYAEPLHEPSLLQLLDADAVNSLLRRQVLTVRTSENGTTALATRLPIVAEAVRTHMSPVQRVALARACFQALLSEDTTLTADSRLRLVRFGIESGSEVPVHWISQAMQALGRSGDLRFILRLALAAMPHDDDQRAAEAIMRACDLAHFLGDRRALDEALDALNALLSNRMRFASLPFPLQFTLATASVCFNPSYDGSPDRALAAFESWEHTWTQQGIDAARFTRPCRMRVLAMNGRLDEALRAGTVEAGVRDLHEEWLSAPARTFEALLRVQRGEFREALSLAETTRQIIMLHDISPTISGDLEGFALFLAHWARGTTISARQTLEELTGPVRPDFAAVHTTAGLIELALAMFALQEARWYDAAEITGRMLENLTLNDPFGVTPLVHAVASLAHAALGDETQAVDSLRKCDTRAPGISRALHGFVGSITLQTRHWLRDPDLLAHARRLAEWARGEDLPLIELEALDVVAHETASPDTALIERATALASRVDPPIGDAILGHIRALTQTHEPGAPDPEERLLSELGIWQPLPPVGQLTGREREIALFTALGYSSKHIAERLHLSARTIETHLAHVYGKLGVGGREELRRWFSRRREAQ